MNVLPGLIIRSQSGFYTVDTGQGRFVCQLRGRLKQTRVWGDIATIGDRVEIRVHPDGTGSIEEIHPREKALVRMGPTPKGEFQQVLIANPDQVLLIFACAHPEPHLRMLDRFLVICEKQEVPALIVANKVDILGLDAAENIFEHYAPLGYPVIYTSAKQAYGLEELRRELAGKISAFTGPSGVGKSSLLNALQPGLGLAVSDISDATRKGRHTTIVREMYTLAEGGYVADMPGIRALALWDTEPEELDGYFPELSPLVADCQFSNCTHRSEPGCAVRRAVQEGRVHPERYHSYLRLRYGDES